MKTVLNILLLTILFIGTFIIYEKTRNPLSVIDQKAGRISLLKESKIDLEDLPPDRNYQHITLATKHLGKIEALISKPKTHNKKLPVLLIMAGWEVRAKYLKLIPNPDEYIIVFYLYPYSSQDWKKGNIFYEMFNIKNAIYSVPSQVLTLVKWLSSQNMVDHDRISLLGFSLGAIFAPSVYHLDSHRDQSLKQGVIAFGGADLYEMFNTNLRNVSSAYRPMLSYAIAKMIWAIEPARHLPNMQNEFLLINGSKDEMITQHSVNMFHRLTPEPKIIVFLDTEHIQPKKSDLINKLIEMSNDWLRQKGVLDPAK